jgi:hypothetical protein
VIIRTCSYAAWRPEMGQPVRITLGLPRWPHPPGRERWPFLAEAAPAGWYFRSAPEKFARCYVAQLDRLAGDIETKLGWLAERYPGQALFACCFERRVSEGDCHRLLLSRWLHDRLGLDVPELDPRERTRS